MSKFEFIKFNIAIMWTCLISEFIQPIKNIKGATRGYSSKNSSNFKTLKMSVKKYTISLLV